jgi:glyoxylase-like metal-dependent hydrolase (beta-lactamase superfamily II)
VERDMKLVLLGTSGYHPNDARHTACLMIPERGIVLDAGTAFFRVRDYLATRELDIFITHAHLDHVVGLTYLLDVLYERDVRRVTVHGTAEKLAAIQEHLFAEPIFPVKPPCEFRPLAGAVELGSSRRRDRFSARLDRPRSGLRHRHHGRAGRALSGSDPRR